MAETIFYKEFNGLPEKLEKWGMKAISKIEAPEKRHEAAKFLRKKMDCILLECETWDEEEKTEYVLKKLGKAHVVAEELKASYAVKNNLKTDRIAGIIVLFLSMLCAVYPAMVFFVFSKENADNASIYANWLTGKGAGAAAACAITLFVLGIWLLLHNRSKKGEGNV